MNLKEWYKKSKLHVKFCYSLDFYLLFDYNYFIIKRLEE